MASKFEKASTRMFCISGVLSDIYCTPDLKVLSLEELLNQRLHALGFRSVVFYSGAKGRFFALDEDGKRGLGYTRRQNKNEKAEKPPEGAGTGENKAPASTTSVAGFGRRTGGRNAENTQKHQDGGSYFIKVKDDQAPEYANAYMKDTTEQKALVFTSLEDFVNNSSGSRRSYYAYFEDWKSLPNENRNICIFLSKSIDSRNLQQIFNDNSTLALQSMFIRGVNSSGAEFNQNSSLIVSSPLNDEIGNILEYLRIKGYTYTTRDENNNDVTVVSRITFRHTEKEKIVRALSFYSRESEYSELKSMKESIESYMAEQKRAIVEITPDVVSTIYSLSNKKYKDVGDPLEVLKNCKGWEAAYEVINSFVVSHRSRYGTNPTKNSTGSGTGIERLEPDRSASSSLGKVPNFVLQGPPGVGKSEIASLIGQILQHEGVLKSGHTVEGSRDKLIGQYIGSTAIQTAAMIEQAQEGVLLIDEVYNLAEDNKGMSSGANYCAEAINTLVAAMTSKSKRFCVIFAGYAERMDEVWNMNEGLLSRFGESNIINLEGYKPDLLQSIFESHFGKPEDDSSQCIILSDEVKEGLPVFFENLYSDRDRENFGNARDMNTLAATVKRQSSYRYIQENLTGDIIVEKKDFGKNISLFEKRGLSTEDIYAKIYEYVGLDFLVDMFNDQLALKIEYEEKGLEYPGPSHMIWCGNPGTGKSTAAQLTADLYHSLGILGGKEPIYIDASEIMSSHIGGGAEEINRRMDEACQHNTILVIEEAYQLAKMSNGREVIHAMLNRMETDRKNFNVIFVLYTELRDEFLRVNPGMESRVRTYEFKDYNAEQLMQIFMKMCEKTKDSVSDEAKEKITKLLTQLYKSGATAKGNARIVRTLIETMRQNRYRRITDELAVQIHGVANSETRGQISAARAMKKIQMPQTAYCFEASDVPDDYSYAVSASTPSRRDNCVDVPANIT
ncbi:MAG: AAA family ATPase [Ruminiclostridium sp.]|nr:AAA family ATPase [Ruminiclostridium sp.]